ncbi:TonB-dependent receptor [Chelativorans sp. YIM 93263]|uniref:TonB-dependent receptor n=1 Tax=Chelativorans sp. YIM 93263 TaxID=2906648 RepID=UPI002378F271|nr:TonB-dependent receptor [Chelativorans sp. YIM 93263]
MRFGHGAFLLTASASVLALLMPAAGAQEACTDGACLPAVTGKALNDSASGTTPVGANTERARAGDEPSIPFRISVDGETVDESAAAGEAAADLAPGEAKPPLRQAQERPVDRQRQTDVGLSAVDIQVKFDGLEVEPLLNVSTMPVERTYRAGETVTFFATSNYPAFIERAEIRIYQADRVAEGRPVAVVPVAINGTADWQMPAAGDGDFAYVLRVYGERERYDETVPLTIARSERELERHRAEAVAPGWGEDRTAFRNIPLNGGAVTVYGRNVPPGYRVEALGETIPVDPDQAFVVSRILPPGDHAVDVGVKGASKTGGLSFSRDINIPDDDWFYVGLADLTIGKRTGDDGIEAVRPGEYDEVYSKGRLAFYLKGKIKGEYLLTAAADTGEDDLDSLWRNLDKQDPRRILRRLDPDDYYPVYGDDSTMVEDAPTNGKFYVRLERGDSHVMWGNYKTRISGTEFLRSDRALYGASATYRSQETTSFGERRTEATAYAAQPDTLPQREEFLGTGGSAYFLKRQDIVEGSETLTVQRRDAVTGRVIERTVLTYGEDYSFDYMQGVIILRRPLHSMTGTDGPVRNGAIGGDDLYLVADYEYEPVAGEVDGYVYGGRAQHWLNDHVRVGVTGMDEDTGMADQRAYGADIRIRHSERTFLEAEIAHSKGPGFNRSVSTDGGLSWGNDLDDADDPIDRAATAWRVEGQVALDEIGAGVDGTVGGYYEEKERGFSTLHDQARANRRVWGAHADLALSEDAALALSYDDLSDDDGQRKRDGAAAVSWQYDQHWKISFGVTYSEIMSRFDHRGDKHARDGSRLDAGVRVDYRIDDDRLVYAFGQGTLDHTRDIDRNDRVGVGAEVQFTDTIGVTGEVSYGTQGVGGLAGVTYDPTADEHYYLGYKLDPDRAFSLTRNRTLSGRDKGTIVAGMRRRMGDTLSSYTESNYDLYGDRRSLTQTYGVLYTPDAQWTVDGGLEVGRVRDDTVDDNGNLREDFDRYAPSLAIGYEDEEAGIKARVRGEVRIERSDDETRDQNTYLFAAGLNWKTNPDWRLLTSVDAVISDSGSNQTAFTDTDYVEASLGYAYRPVEHDKLNALFKYTWLYDLPGNNQVISGATGDRFAPAQRSHIVSADVVYDVKPWLSVGGKYGFRYGEVRYRVDDGTGTGFENEWQKSSAHLGILRTDLHFVKNWDLLLEGRVMHMPEADTTEYGALAAVYRHVGDNFKVGLGYNFGHFSDDLRDLTMDDQGVFLNIIGKL